MTETGVSVIIPCYNGEAFLSEAIESALKQTVAPLEVVVVDDGSTDRSAAIAGSFGPPVRVVSQANAGLSSARNTGIAASQGEWIAFLDCDDLWVSDKLEKQLAKAGQGYEFVYCDAENFGACEGWPNRRADYVAMPEGDVFVDLVKENFVTASGVIMNRSLLNRIGRFRTEFVAAEDWGFWMEAALTAKFGCVRETLVRYRVHAGGMSRDPQRMLIGCMSVLKWVRQLDGADKAPPSAYRKAIANVHSSVGLLSERAGKRKNAVKHNLRAIWLDPLSRPRWKNLIRAALGLK